MTGRARGRGGSRDDQNQRSENPAHDEKKRKQKGIPGLSYVKKSLKTSDIPEPTSPIYDERATSSKSKELKAKKLSSEGGEGTSSELMSLGEITLTGKARRRGGFRDDQNQRSESPPRDKKRKEAPESSYVKRSSKTSDVFGPTSSISSWSSDQRATSSTSKKELQAKKLSPEGFERTSSELMSLGEITLTGKTRRRSGPSNDQYHKSENPVCKKQKSSNVQSPSNKPGKVSQAENFSTEGGEGTSSGLMARCCHQEIVTTRPQERCETKKGSFGDKVMVKSNYFRLLSRPQWTLYEYNAVISPEEDRTSVRRGLLKVHYKTIGSYIFDGRMLYTVKRLFPEPMVLISKRDGDGTIMTITLNLIRDITPGDYVYIQICNILMRRLYSLLKLQLLGRDFYDQEAKIDIGEYNLQIWPGYKTTIAQYETSILMVAEIMHKLIRTDSVLDNLRDMQQQDKNYKYVFKKRIAGHIVLTYYNNNTYLINDVDWNSTPKTTFLYNGDEVSYVDYYRRRYQIFIKDHDQPLLVSLPKKKDIRRGMTNMIMLIPELCKMTGLTDRMRSNYRLTKALSNHTHVDPESRIRRLLAFNKRLQETPECKDELQNWNMKIDRNLIEIQARCLPQETIYQGSGQGSGQSSIKYPSGNSTYGWIRNLRSNPFFSSAPVNTWAVITSENQQNNSTRSFINIIIKVAAGMSFHLPQPTITYVGNENLANYINAVEMVISNSNLSILLCCVNNNRLDLYNAIKKKCCLDRAIPSQVVTIKSMNHNSNYNIATKIAIQMNCKLGGAPWKTHQPLSNLMVVGYDVCHDPQNKSNTYAAMVSSVNQSQTKYFSRVTRHFNGEEIGTEFCINMRLALQKYNSVSGQYPEVIIIYRDGVGEGQISHVLQHEVEIVKSTLEEVYGKVKYKLQFVIVSKRINTRFFLSATNGNPQPGTVIDDVVTNPNRYDFFLISQCVRFGTVVPTSYNIIFDNTGLTPDYSQRLAYKFCHMYFNVCGQIRVPAPCLYAHKLAFLASQNLHNVPNPALSSVLFYL